MLVPKASVFERIEQSITLFKNNFAQIFLPLFVYKFLTLWFIFYAISFFSLQKLDIEKIFNASNSWGEWWPILLFNNYLIYVLLIFFIFFIVYIIFVIPFFIATIKAIKNSYFEVENNLKDNINYWFSRMFQLFKTYFYIFKYVFLIPALVIIFWSTFLVLWEYQNIDFFLKIWTFTFFFWIILTITFYIYRWIEVTFSLYSAIDKDEFDKENFEDSVSLTKNNWWRIVWNILLISIIIFLFLWLISKILWYFLTKQEFWTNSIEVVKNFLIYIQTFNILDFTINLIDIFFVAVFEIFMFVFIYIFYKRIELEKNGDTSSKEKLDIVDKKEVREF